MAGVDVSVMTHQCLDEFDIPPMACPHQRDSTLVILTIHIGSIVHQLVHERANIQAVDERAIQ